MRPFKEMRNLHIASFFLIAAILLLGSCTCESEIDSLPSTPSSPPRTTRPVITEYPEPPNIIRLTQHDEEELARIVLSDTRVQNLIKDKDYAFTVNNHEIKGQDWHLSVGVILKEGLTTEERRQWAQKMREGHIDHSIIAKYLGILMIGDIMAFPVPGYFDIYEISIDYDHARVESIFMEPRSDIQIPQLTLSERKHAVTLAMNDARVQEILNGKTYELAPTGVHVWLDEYLNKQGAIFEIWLGGTYSIDVSETGQYDRGSVLGIRVDLQYDSVLITVQGGPA